MSTGAGSYQAGRQYARTAGNEEDHREQAAKAGTGTIPGGWLVWGMFSHEFVAFPLFHVPPGRCVAARAARRWNAAYGRPSRFTEVAAMRNDEELGVWSRQQRESRSWACPEMARQLISAARRSGDTSMPGVDSVATIFTAGNVATTALPTATGCTTAGLSVFRRTTSALGRQSALFTRPTTRAMIRRYWLLPPVMARKAGA